MAPTAESAWPSAFIRAGSQTTCRRVTLRIGVIGLGTGTLAAYGWPGDYFRFYEINPEVIRLSEKYFTYRKNSPAHIDVVRGDARISMELEQQRRQPQEFDVLAVDAFNSDAIPVHLLTRECFRTYLYHLKNDGILAVHISNRYFDLQPVVRSLASLDPKQGLQALWIDDEKDESRGIAATTWILLTANQSFHAHPEIRKRITQGMILSPGCFSGPMITATCSACSAAESSLV